MSELTSDTSPDIGRKWCAVHQYDWRTRGLIHAFSRRCSATAARWECTRRRKFLSSGTRRTLSVPNRYRGGIGGSILRRREMTVNTHSAVIAATLATFALAFSPQPADAVGSMSRAGGFSRGASAHTAGGSAHQASRAGGGGWTSHGGGWVNHHGGWSRGGGFSYVNVGGGGGGHSGGGGGHSGGGGWAGHGGSGWGGRGGGWGGHGGWHHHDWDGWRGGWGGWGYGWGWGPYWDPWVWGSDYSYYEPTYPAYAAPDLGALPSAPPPPAYWYYCQPAKTYYPYVRQCPQPWVPVTPGQ